MLNNAKNRRLLAVNDGGHVIGEQHPRAKLTDRQVDQILDALEKRDRLVLEMRAAGATVGAIHRAIRLAQLGFVPLARLHGVSRRTVRDIYEGRIRCQVPTRWVVPRQHRGA